MHFKFHNEKFELSPEHCILFGVLNVTPDSFSDGGHYTRIDAAIAQMHLLEESGAAVIDVGGESTRPGASPVGLEEELQRVIPVIRALKRQSQLPISIDTTKATVAEAALAEGAVIVNDVSGMTADSAMAKVIANSGASVIVVHRRGTAATMQSLCQYNDVVKEVRQELQEILKTAFEAGIPSCRIAIDPGIGFSKTREQNLKLIRNLKAFTSLGQPIMIGVSRKSFLGGELQTRAPGSLAVELWAYLQGVQIIRTHDVAATHNAIRMWNDIKSIPIQLEAD